VRWPERAAELVGHGDVIALDSSTTCYHLALELVTRRNLVVITNGLRTATLLIGADPRDGAAAGRRTAAGRRVAGRADRLTC